MPELLNAEISSISRADRIVSKYGISKTNEARFLERVDLMPMHKIGGGHRTRIYGRPRR